MAVLDWEKLLSKKRLGAEDNIQMDRPGRTEFESDVDRLVFSSAFRRLGRKTQVHPMAANDHVHTRLTHSLEVSRVGNALGKELGQRLKSNGKLPDTVRPDDLGAVVQAACLAHDLGNPPFGHAGEDAIIHWFDQNRLTLPTNLEADLIHDLTSFEGNAQGFRVITQLENHIFSGGLRLTYATLAAFQKYPWSSALREKKFGAFISEVAILNRIFAELDIPKNGERWSRHPLAFLVEAADDICYGIIDIEDAVELRIIPFKAASDTLLAVFSTDERAEIESTLEGPGSHRVNFARMRGRVFDKAISGAIDAFIERYDDIMAGKYSAELFKILSDNDPRRLLIANAKSLGRSSIYIDTRKVEIEIGCYATLDSLLREFCSAALNKAEVLADKSGETRRSGSRGMFCCCLATMLPLKIMRQKRDGVGISAYAGLLILFRE